VSITDGDTFRAHMPTDAAGASTPIRLIGIDSPELKRPVQCYGPEARTDLSALIPVGTEVHLVYDRDRVDRYDRVLAYVEVIDRDGQTVDVGESMVGRGAAIAKRYPPNTARAEVLERSQASAEAGRLGLWGACR
jgi:micrococcal nuclease